MDDSMPPVQEVESLDSMKFLTKAELVEQIVRPLEEVCLSMNLVLWAVFRLNLTQTKLNYILSHFGEFLSAY